MTDHEATEWCNCQAIKGTASYPGPWHPWRDEEWYPCAQYAVDKRVAAYLTRHGLWKTFLSEFGSS